MNTEIKINENEINIIELKKILQEIKTKKGITSRKIGLAKKNSMPIDEYVKEVSDCTNKMKLLQDRIKLLTHKNIEPDNSQKLHSTELPSQFISRCLENSESTISVSVCENMKRWDDFINNNVNSSIYHSSAIRKVVELTFGHNCYYLIAEDEQQDIQGVLPLVELKSKLFGHFLISMPFYNYGGVLAKSYNAEKLLLKSAMKLGKSLNVNHIEYRHCFSTDELPSRSDKVAMLLSLPDSKELLWASFSSKLRSQIKKPIKLGAQSVIGREELVDDFYIVFSRNMRDLGTPVYSKLFFINMLKYNTTANLVLIYINDKPVSAGFVLGWRNTLEIPWASTLKNANKYSANMMLYWEILQFAIERKYKVFDFGRSSKNSSTYRFKKQWGASEKALHWHYWLKNESGIPQINPNNPKYKLLINVWKNLPVSVVNILGPHIVKYLP